MKLNPIVLALLFIFTLGGCATERTATGEPIESGTIRYEFSKEELDEYFTKKERVTFFGGFYPNDAIRARLEIKLDRDSVRPIVLESLEDVGFVYRIEETEPVPEIISVVNSGLLNMNKSVFWVRLENEGSNTVISILAIAFEGLIKQNTNGKAIERLILSLEENSGLKVKMRLLDP